MKAICYIDSDNSEAKKILPILDYLSEDENLTIMSRKAYGDFWNNVNWKEVCLRNNIIPVFSKSHSGTKNSTDMKLVIDAHTDLLQNNCIEVFVIFSNDSDFVPISMEIQYYGKEVWIVGHKNNVSKSLLKLCNKFIDIDLGNIHNNVTKKLNDNLNLIFYADKKNIRLSVIRMLPQFTTGDLNPKLFGYSKFISFIRKYIQHPYYIEMKTNNDAWICKNGI